MAEIGSKVLIPMNSFKLLFYLREQLPQPRHALHGSASQPRHNPGESRFRVGRSTQRHPALAKQSTENRGNFEVCCDALGVGGCRLEYLLLRGHVQPFLREKIHREGLLPPLWTLPALLDPSQWQWARPLKSATSPNATVGRLARVSTQSGQVTMAAAMAVVMHQERKKERQAARKQMLEDQLRFNRV